MLFNCRTETELGDIICYFFYLRTEGRQIVKVASENSVNGVLVPGHGEGWRVVLSLISDLTLVVAGGVLISSQVHHSTEAGLATCYSAVKCSRQRLVPYLTYSNIVAGNL